MLQDKVVGKTRLLAILVVFLAVILDILDTSIINVALPTLQYSLHASYNLLQWVLVGYTLSFAVLLITGGRLGDIFGYKKLFMIGVAIFGTASLLCGLAPNIDSLVGLRVLQGAAAALMVPQGTSLIQLLYAPAERGKIIGLFGAIGGLSAMFGPIIGGILLHANIGGYGWRPLFLINVPVSIMALVAGYYFLPKGKSPHPLRVDGIGTALLVTTLGLFTLPLIEGRDLHWPLWTLLMLLASVPLLILFICYERRRNIRGQAALIELSLFKQSTFIGGIALNTFFQLIVAGMLLTFMLTMQQYLGYTAIRAAITNLPLILGMIGGVALIGERLMPKLGRYVVTLGSILLASGTLTTSWVLSRYGTHIHTWQFVPGLLITGIGMGLVAGPLFAITLQNVDKAHVGSASGIVEAVDQLGGVFGVVIIGALFFGQLTHGFGHAFAWSTVGTAVVAAIMCTLSFRLPRRFKSEAELDIEH